MTANELIQLAEGRVVLELPQNLSLDAVRQNIAWAIEPAAGGLVLDGGSLTPWDSILLPEPVALALTVAAIEAGLEALPTLYAIQPERVLRDGEYVHDGYVAIFMDKHGAGTRKVPCSSARTRAAALAALLREMPKGTTV